MRKSLGLGLAGCLFWTAQCCHAESWPQWRGPHLDGSSTEQNLPASLDPGKDLRWSIVLPGPGAGTPVVVGNHIFVSAVDVKTRKLLAIAVAKMDGKILWQKEVAIDSTTNDRNNLASPSPMADEQNAYFYYGTGDLVAFDHEGNSQWSYNVQKAYGKFHMQWLESATPLLLKGKIYIPVLQRDTGGGGGFGRRGPGGRGGPPGGPPSGGRGDPNDNNNSGNDNSMADSFLLCLDASTGKELWRVVRPTDAVQESREAYTTPIAIPVGDQMQIVLMGGDHITGHDAETGKELWRSENYNPSHNGDWRTVASATFGDGLVFASAPKRGSLFAVQPTDGAKPQAATVWTSRDFSTDVCAPLFYKDQLYVLNGDRRTLNCLDPKTGQKKWSLTFNGRGVFRGSPTGADDKIYCMSEGGEVFVASTEGKLLSNTNLNSAGPARSTIVAADGVVYVRTTDHLDAFANK